MILRLKLNIYLFFLIGAFIIFISITCQARQEVNKIFPLDNYPQNLNYWFNENKKNYKTLYLSRDIQQLYYKILKQNYYGKNSPWDKTYIDSLIQPEPHTQKTIFKGETLITNIYKNSISYTAETTNTLYGINYRRLNISWLNQIIDNMNLPQFQNLKYSTTNRAITIDKTMVMSIPTNDPGFYSHKIAGSGYPFNLFNLSHIPPGMPVYVFGVTVDHAWAFIVAPGVMGWVNINNIAYVNQSFITTWTDYAMKNLGVILTGDCPVIDTNNKYRFSAQSGTLLPLYKKGANSITVMIPVKTSNNTAIIRYASIQNTHSAVVPLALTMENFAKVVKSLIGKPYGWGGINYYNDCSLELMAIYKAFGIFLLRNSAAQASYSGQMIDISKLSEPERRDMIIKNSIPFATLLYFKGHIMIYLGTYNTDYSKHTIMTYQNIWGLSSEKKEYRDIIGQAVIFPLLHKYPENPKNMSLVAKNPFIIVNLIKPINRRVGLSNLLY